MFYGNISFIAIILIEILLTETWNMQINRTVGTICILVISSGTQISDAQMINEWHWRLVTKQMLNRIVPVILILDFLINLIIILSDTIECFITETCLICSGD